MSKKMSEVPELEMVYGVLVEIDKKLEKVNKNLEYLNRTLEIYLNEISEALWRSLS